MSGFLESYMDAFYSIEGWFSPDAALLFMAYNQLIEAEGISGHVLEIGVYHGLSSIAIASLRGPGMLFWAVDMFDAAQMPKASAFRLATGSQFMNNFQKFYEDTSFLRLIARNSQEVTPADLGSVFSFCHIDGGHSAEETYHDFDLCWQVLLPGGLLAVDDYFNASFPGVSEGAIEFMMDHQSALIPIAIGFNKVLFQKAPSSFDLNSKFSSFFDHVNFSETLLWKQPVFVFDFGFRNFFDLRLSTPQSLVRPAGYVSLRARFEPALTKLQLQPGQTMDLPVTVINESRVPFVYGDELFGLSYHLLTADGAMLRWDNKRTHFLFTFEPGMERSVVLPIEAPNEKGHYLIEVDIVCEGKTWFKAWGNRTAILYLAVV